MTPTSNLFTRYMQAFRAVTEHLKNCTTCDLGDDTVCADGGPLHTQVYRAGQHAEQRHQLHDPPLSYLH